MPLQRFTVLYDSQAIRITRVQGDPGLPWVDSVTLGAGNEVVLVSQIVDLATVAFPDDLAVTYIVKARNLDGCPAIICPFCDRPSHNPNDATNRYCDACHVFIEDEWRRRRYS